MADVLITAESQAQTNADGTPSCIHLPNVEAEAEHIRAVFGKRAEKHSRISVGRLDELLKDKRIWFCPAHGDAMLQGEPVLAFESDGRLEAVSIDTLVNTVRQHTGLRLIVLTGCCTARLGQRLLDGTSVADVVCWDTTTQPSSLGRSSQTCYRDSRRMTSMQQQLSRAPAQES